MHNFNFKFFSFLLEMETISKYPLPKPIYIRIIFFSFKNSYYFKFSFYLSTSK